MLYATGRLRMPSKLSGDIKLYMDGQPMPTFYHIHTVHTTPTPVMLENVDKVAVGCVDWDWLRGPFSRYTDQDMASVEVWFDVLSDEQVMQVHHFKIHSYLLQKCFSLFIGCH